MPGSEEKEGAGAGLGGWKAAPTPAPPTKEAVLPLCSLSLTTCLAPFAVCTVDRAGAGRAPASLLALAQKGGSWGKAGGTALGRELESL